MLVDLEYRYRLKIKNYRILDIPYILKGMYTNKAESYFKTKDRCGSTVV